MPSPLGHVLGGIAAGHLVAGRLESEPADRQNPKISWRGIALFGALGAVPDIDLLVGMHSRHTHSVAAVAVVFVVGLLACRTRRRPVLLAAGMAAAYASHILLDWLGNDTTPPIGIMALWPFTDGFYQSDLHWFFAIWRQYGEGFVLHNLTAAAWEVLVLGPVAAGAWWLGRGTDTEPTRNGHGTITE